MLSRYAVLSLGSAASLFCEVCIVADKETIEQLINNHEGDLLGNIYTYDLSDGTTVSFQI